MLKMEDGDGAEERHKPGTGDGSAPDRLEQGPTGGQGQPRDSPGGEDPEPQHRHAGPSKREPSAERRSAAARPPPPDHGLDNLAESPVLRSTLQEMLRNVIREQTRPLENKLQEIETALGKKVDSETSSPTTSRESLPPPRHGSPPANPPPNPPTNLPANPPASPLANRLTVRFSDDVENSEDPGRRRPRSPNPPEGRSVVDQAWGELFDGKDEPTARLEEVLRGLANYIAEQFLPTRSLVVTPGKLFTLYSHCRSSRHPFLYEDMFLQQPGRAFHDAVGGLYLALGCEYHLVQPEEKRRPSVPGLTPAGFTRWMVVNILAYPDEEARRLDKIVSLFPIEADSPHDSKRERLPKQISRRLLPACPDEKHRGMLDAALGVFARASKEQPAKPRPLDTAAAAKDRHLPPPSPRGGYASSPRRREAREPRQDDERGAVGRDRDRDRDRGRDRDRDRRGAGGEPSPASTSRSHPEPPAPSRRQSHPGASHLLSPLSTGSRPSASRRSRSPQARSYRGSNSEVHHGGGGEDSRRASVPVFSFTSPSASAPVFELPSVPERPYRERDRDRDRDRPRDRDRDRDRDREREREQTAYRLYSSPRESRTSVDEVPRISDRQLALVMAPATEGEPGETWEDYFNEGGGQGQGPGQGQGFGQR